MPRKTEGDTPCDDAPGRLVPIVNTHKCENKGPCVEVCPYDVFEIRPLTNGERRTLPWRVRLKVWAHGGKQSFVVRPDACHACGLCVPACPEGAITLGKAAAAT